MQRKLKAPIKSYLLFQINWDNWFPDRLANVWSWSVSLSSTTQDFLLAAHSKLQLIGFNSAAMHSTYDRCCGYLVQLYRILQNFSSCVTLSVWLTVCLSVLSLDYCCACWVLCKLYCMLIPRPNSIAIGIAGWMVAQSARTRAINYYILIAIAALLNLISKLSAFLVNTFHRDRQQTSDLRAMIFVHFCPAKFHVAAI